MNSILAERINQIESLQDLHLRHLIVMMNADSGQIFGVDLLAQAAFKRSMSLCAGFVCLVRSKNYLSAATLVRLQLDTCLRFFAAFIVESPHDFAQSILIGVPVRKLKDRSGQLMTDRYLVETLGKKYDWMPRVYKATSGFIHLSESHMFSVWKPGTEGELEIVIGATDDHLEDELWVELADAFLACTDALFEYINGWILTKQTVAVARQSKI